jgi:hypothetical protein
MRDFQNSDTFEHFLIDSNVTSSAFGSTLPAGSDAVTFVRARMRVPKAPATLDQLEFIAQRSEFLNLSSQEFACILHMLRLIWLRESQFTSYI